MPSDTETVKSAPDIPYVSVVLPTYNRAYCLARSIESVLNQSFADFELLILDDGSTDGTKDLVERYDDPRIVYVQNPDNQGQTKRLNQGIGLARAPLVAFQDSDDAWLPEKLALQVTAMRSAPPEVGVVYCDRWRIVDGGERTLAAAVHITPEDGLFYEAALNGGIYDMATQCLLVRRECFDVVGGFEEKIQVLNDLEMLIRLSSRFLFQHVAKPLVDYHVSGDALSGSGEGPTIRSWAVIYEKYRKDLSRFPRRQAQLAYWIGSYYMRAADSDASAGRAYLTDALKACPTNPRYLAAFVISLFGSAAYASLYRRLR
jgi:glycosyltransferase involved in cell wall biosynthesis